MAPADIASLVTWLGDAPAALVQMPQAEYTRLAPGWRLPRD
jgi:hypothetical protein